MSEELFNYTNTWMLQCYLLATRCLSLTSALSNHMWGEDLTMAVWIIPSKPPCTWPTWEITLSWIQLSTHNLSLHKYSIKLNYMITYHYENWTHTLAHKRRTEIAYQRVAAIIGQDYYINWGCVIGHTDAVILWFVLSAVRQDKDV